MHRYRDINDLMKKADIVEEEDFIRDRRFSSVAGFAVEYGNIGKLPGWLVETPKGNDFIADPIVWYKNIDWSEMAQEIFDSLSAEDHESGDFDDFINVYLKKLNPEIDLH